MKKIYFAGSICGGRNDLELYKKIINHLQLLGDVLTEHIGDSNITPLSDIGKSDQQIYVRDLDWLRSSDILIADVSTPSLGVGYEISKAVELNKKVLCLYRIQENKKLSAMIAGCPDIQVKKYQTFEDIKQIINNFFQTI